MLTAVPPALVGAVGALVVAGEGLNKMSLIGAVRGPWCRDVALWLKSLVLA